MALRKLVASLFVRAVQPRPRFVLAVAALVAPVPPLTTATAPTILDAAMLVIFDPLIDDHVAGEVAVRL